MSDHVYPPPPPPPTDSRLEEAVSQSGEPKRSLEIEAPAAQEPTPKRQRPDGSLEKVSPAVLAAAKDIDEWIAARKRNWPTASRVQERLTAKSALPAEDSSSPAGHQPAADPDLADLSSATPKLAAKPICRYFMRGKCRAGSSCKFSHERRPHGPTIYKRFEAPVRNSLFVKLMQSDHDSEDLKILEFISQLDAAGRLD